MQRMLVGLVIFLTVMVAVLTVMMIDLSDRVDSQGLRARDPGAGARGYVEDPADADEVAKLDRRVENLLRKLEVLERQQRETAKAIARQAARGSDASTPSKTPDGARLPEVDPNTYARPERRAGEIEVTEEDEAFYIAVKEAVDRKRRIKGQLANNLRRIDRLVTEGAIQSMSDQTRGKVEEAVLRYVVATDGIMQRYYRRPNDQVQALPAEQRRSAATAEREEAQAAVERELALLIGAGDAATVAERTFQSRRMRRPGDFRRGR